MVVCERVWRIQVCVHSRGFSWLDLASGSWLVTHQNAVCVKHAGSWRVMTAGVLQDKKGQSGLTVISRLIPVANESPEHPILQKNVFHIPRILYYKCPYTHEMQKASREKFERKTLKKNKIDSFTILDIWFFKFLYFHSLHWHTLERFISQILISPYPYQRGGNLVLGKQFKNDQFIWLMQ